MHPTDGEIDELIERIDADLAQQRVEVHWRLREALSALSRALGGMDLPTATRRFPHPGHPNARIALRLFDWYDRRYGDALNVNWDIGTIAVPIRGAVWRGRIRRIYGEVELYAAREPDPLAGKPVSKKRGNVLDSVEKLPQGLRDSLSDVELVTVFRLFQLGMEAHYCLASASADSMVRAARADHAAAVDHLVDTAHYGQSKWASLQAAEKTLKAAIARKGGSFPRRGHPIAKLAELARTLGFPEVPRDVVEAIECSSAPRYGEEEVKMREAVDAHHAALAVARLARDILGEGIRLA